MNENDRYSPARQDIRSKWDAMPEPTRRYIVWGLVIAAVILAAVLATYVTPGVYPSGEGG